MSSKVQNSDAHHSNNEQFRFLKFNEVRLQTSISKTKWYDLIKQGNAPAPIKLGRSSVWDSRQIQAWQLEQIANSGGEA